MDIRAQSSGDHEIWLLQIKERGVLILGLEGRDNGTNTRTFKRLGAVFDLYYTDFEKYEGGVFDGLEEEDFMIL